MGEGTTPPGIDPERGSALDDETVKNWVARFGVPTEELLGVETLADHPAAFFFGETHNSFNNLDPNYLANLQSTLDHLDRLGSGTVINRVELERKINFYRDWIKVAQKVNERRGPEGTVDLYSLNTVLEQFTSARDKKVSQIRSSGPQL